MRNSFQIALNLFRDSGGVMRTAEARRKGINERTLANMLDAGLLEKVSRGLYRLTELPPIGNPDLVTVALKTPAGVICLISALAFHDLTTQIPHRVYVALPRGVKKPHLEYPPLATISLSARAYAAGIEIHILDGVPVKIYNREKTVADCFKFRNKIGLDVALEAMKTYLRQPGHNIDSLMHYAAIDRVQNVMRPYLEAAI